MQEGIFTEEFKANLKEAIVSTAERYARRLKERDPALRIWGNDIFDPTIPALKFAERLQITDVKLIEIIFKIARALYAADKFSGQEPLELDPHYTSD